MFQKEISIEQNQIVTNGLYLQQNNQPWNKLHTFSQKQTHFCLSKSFLSN